MKVGSLVKRKPKWGDWVKHNPWMTDEKDLRQVLSFVLVEQDTGTMKSYGMASTPRHTTNQN